jgi:hypothetical protein
MTIEMEAGASQLQCSMRPISSHLILTSGRLRAVIHVADESGCISRMALSRLDFQRCCTGDLEVLG